MKERSIDLLSASFWILVAGIFGLTFYLQQVGSIDSMRWYFVGGVLLVLVTDTLIRLLFSRVKKPLVGRTAILVGLLFVAFSETSWTIILFAVGALVIVYGLLMAFSSRFRGTS